MERTGKSVHTDNTAKTRHQKRDVAVNPSIFVPVLLNHSPIQRKASCACGGGCPSCQSQSNLPVSQPGDASEIEADRMAERVMRMTDYQSQTTPLSEKVTSLVQTKSEGNSNETISSELSSRINSAQGGGSNLDIGTRSFMQNRFGTDFSRVKIHTDSESAQMNRELGARAFTLGNDIYFSEGQYRPESESGKRLLAHELTHTIQQNNGVQQKIIQRDLAVEPTVANPTVRTLNAAQIQAAINWNSVVFTDADEIALIRDVIGASSSPAVIDETFVQKLVQYQASFGLTQDGMLGSATALRLANELQEEANSLGAEADVGSPTEMAINPAQRRMRLRSRVISRLGNLRHQGFVGARDNPEGIVTVRTGVDASTLFSIPAATNTIEIDYTGSNADSAHWLQFINSQMFTGTGAARVFHTGSITTTNGTYTFSNATTTNWVIDSASATNPFYEAGFINVRNAARNTTIFDQPQGGASVAEAFAAAQSTRPASVTGVDTFNTYLIVNNRAVYLVSWTATYVFDTSVSPVAEPRATYRSGTTGAVTRLPANLRTVLTTRYSGSLIR